MLLFFSKEVNIVLIFMFLCVIIMIINTKVKQKVNLVLVFEKKVVSLQHKKFLFRIEQNEVVYV